MIRIVWGPEIAVEGKRPEWLDDADIITIRSIDGYEAEARSGDFSGSDWDWWQNDAGEDRIVAIRLPANHPHYAAQQPRTAPSGGEVGPEVTERAFAVVRAFAAVESYHAPTLNPIFDEARAIVALLPEPVDALEQVIADTLCSGNDIQPFEIAEAIRNSPAARRALAAGDR